MSRLLAALLATVSLTLAVSAMAPKQLPLAGADRAEDAEDRVAERQIGEVSLVQDRSADAVRPIGFRALQEGAFRESTENLRIQETGHTETGGSVAGVPVGCVTQPPNQANAYYSDRAASAYLAEDFVLGAQERIDFLIFWGAYDSNTPMPVDCFTVIFREDAGGLPGAEINRLDCVPATSRVVTGALILDYYDEYEYMIEIDPNKILGPGTFWVEIYNDTIGHPGDWAWESGNVDPLLGIPGIAGSRTFPEPPWLPDSGVDLAFDLICKAPLPKWSQPPEGEGEDIPSNMEWVGGGIGRSVVVADDFVSDGRPIDAVRWWGSDLKQPCQKPVPPGDDCWGTLCNGDTYVDFGSPSIPAVPADFFEPGSDPFEGVIALGGQGGGTDTVVSRLEEMCLEGELPISDATLIQIAQLDLVGCDWITVTYNGGQNPEEWDVRVFLHGPQPLGMLAATKLNSNGGTFNTDLDVFAGFEFTRIGDGELRTLGAADAGGMLHLSSRGLPWVQDRPPLAGCGGPGFFPGFDKGDETCCPQSCHEGPEPGHKHCVIPPDCPRCPGWEKLCDNPGQGEQCGTGPDCFCLLRPDGITGNCADLARGIPGPCGDDFECEMFYGPGYKCFADPYFGPFCAPNCDDAGGKVCSNPGVLEPCGTGFDCFCAERPDGSGNCVDMSSFFGAECPSLDDGECPPGQKCFNDFSLLPFPFCANNCTDSATKACGNPGFCEMCDSNPNPDCMCAMSYPDDLGECLDLYSVTFDPCMDDFYCEDWWGPGYKCFLEPCLAPIPICAMNCGDAPADEPADIIGTVADYGNVNGDGWFITFHEPLTTGAPQGPPLARYFCDFVDISMTALPACDGHPVNDYSVDLANCCLVEANVDSRTGTTPAAKDSFYEEKCLDYSIGIQAVIGLKYVQDPVTFECLEVKTGRTAPADFWGWHSTSHVCGKWPYEAKPALTGTVKMGDPIKTCEWRDGCQTLCGTSMTCMCLMRPDGVTSYCADINAGDPFPCSGDIECEMFAGPGFKCFNDPCTGPFCAPNCEEVNASWLYGSWSPVIPACSFQNVAFELITNAPGVGDTNDNCVPDQCECFHSGQPIEETALDVEKGESEGNGNNRKNRFISVVTADAGQSQAIRVRFVDLPVPFDLWNGMALFAGEPREVCENSGQGLDVPPANCSVYAGPTRTFWAAPLVCGKENAHYMDWRGTCSGGTCVGGRNPGQMCMVYDDCVSMVHLYHEGIIPSGLYDVQVIDSSCSPWDETRYSDPLAITQSRWGDVCGPSGAGACTAVSDGTVDVTNDVLGVLDKFANVNNLQKARADLEPGDDGFNNGPDLKVNVPNDVLYCLDAFTGATYPFGPGDPCAPGLSRGGK